MLSCSEVSRLCASEALTSAPFLLRLRVRFHLVLCKYCARYVKELRLIGAATRDEFRRLVPDDRRLEDLARAIRERARIEAADSKNPPPG